MKSYRNRTIAILLSLFLILPTLLTACAPAPYEYRYSATYYSEDYVTLDEEYYRNIETNLGSYLSSQGIDYADCYSLPAYIRGYKEDLFWAEVLDGVEIHWKEVPSSVIGEKAKEWLAPAMKEYEDLVAQYDRLGRTFPYADFEEYARARYDYGSSYNSFEEYTLSLATDDLTRLFTLYYVVSQVSTLPTREEIIQRYAGILNDLFTATNKNLLAQNAPTYELAEFEARIIEGYGKVWLWDNVVEELLLESLHAFFDREWTFLTPVIPESEKIAIDKSQIDPADYSQTDLPSDLVRIDITAGSQNGSIYIRLYESVAPKTVANFKELVESGFYKNTVFHRSIKDFCLQGGGADTSGNKKNTDAIIGEFFENGVGNHLSHKTGVVSMARTDGNMNSAASEFFILLSDTHTESLDGNYAAFGYVVYGMEFVERLASIPTNNLDHPQTAIVITDTVFMTKN